MLKKGEVLQDVDDMLLMMHQTGDSYQSYDLDSAPRFHKDDRTSLVEAGMDSGIYMTFLLFYEECVYGTMSVEIEPEDIDFYYAVSLEVGSSLRYLQLSLEQQRYRAELQAIARHDDLTGVYNRSGFMSAAAGYVALHEQETLALVMADLDHLKEINDGFGHLEGDSAICECSRILKEVLGKHSPLGRLGGDEFIGIMSVRSNEDMRTAIELIRRKCKVYNQSSDKPYLVEISAGCVPFSSEEFGQFDSIQRKADLQLYAAKELRRTSSIRSQGQR